MNMKCSWNLPQFREIDVWDFGAVSFSLTLLRICIGSIWMDKILTVDRHFLVYYLYKWELNIDSEWIEIRLLKWILSSGENHWICCCFIWFFISQVEFRSNCEFLFRLFLWMKLENLFHIGFGYLAIFKGTLWWTHWFF